RLVARDFTPTRVADMHEHIGQTCDRLLDGIADRLHAGDVVDLHATWTKPLALDVISDLLGVPPDVRGTLAPDASELAAALGSGSNSWLLKADESARQLEDYFRMLIGLRRRDPRGGLVSALVRRRAEPGADSLSDEELIAMNWILWNVGFEGTA